jgi:hypothetical protein
LVSIDQPGIGIAPRIGLEQTRLIGQDHQRIGFHQVGHQRAQSVVVAELDLVGDHGVILVDHRDDAHVEERAQRRARIEVALAVGHVGMREQHLRRMQAVAAKAALVALHQAHLAHGRGRLQLVHGMRAARPAQALHALRDRAARHQEDALSHAPQLGHLRGPVRNRLGIQSAPLIRHQRRADFHHQRPGLGDHFFESSPATAFITLAQPSPLIAATLNHGRFQRNWPRTFLMRASGSSTASILLNTSQRGLR